MVKGDSGIEVILYSTLFLAAVMSVLWSIQNISPIQLDIQRVNEDVESLAIMFSEACNSYQYNKRYEMRTHTGVLNAYDDRYCINNTRIELCSPTTCDIGYHSIGLANIRYVRVVKDTLPEGEVYNVISE